MDQLRNNLIVAVYNYRRPYNFDVHLERIHNFFAGDIEIGKFCQIGGYVAIHSTNPPLNYPAHTLTSHYLVGP